MNEFKYVNMINSYIVYKNRHFRHYLETEEIFMDYR